MIHRDSLITVHISLQDGPMDTTDISFLLTLVRIPEPKVIDKLILNKTITHIFYDLTEMQDNSYVEILNELTGNQTIDYFFVTDSDYGILDFYEGEFAKYVAP